MLLHHKIKVAVRIRRLDHRRYATGNIKLFGRRVCSSKVKEGMDPSYSWMWPPLSFNHIECRTRVGRALLLVCRGVLHFGLPALNEKMVMNAIRSHGGLSSPFTLLTCLSGARRIFTVPNACTRRTIILNDLIIFMNNWCYLIVKISY